MPFLSDLLRAVRGRYQPLVELQGHHMPVLALAISPMGDLLASGGYEGVKLWDLEKHHQMAVPECGGPRKGAITSILWLPGGGLAYGTTLGFLVIWNHSSAEYRVMNIRKLASEGSVVAMDSCLSSSGSKTSIVVACRDGTVHLYTLGPDDLHHVYTMQLENTVPAAVSFSAGSPFISVFSQNDGEVIKLHSEKGNLISRQASGSDVIGDAAVYKVDGKAKFVIDNGFNGFDLFDLVDCECALRMVSERKGPCFPSRVVFGEEGRVVVGGSGRDTVYLFDATTGSLLDKLPHSGWSVQAVTTWSSSDKRKHLIAVGESGRRGDIQVWERSEEDWVSWEKINDAILAALHVLGRILVVLLACCFLFQRYAEPYMPIARAWIVYHLPADIQRLAWWKALLSWR